MKFQIKNESFLKDCTKRILIKIDPDELIYLGYFLESFEGWCNYTTIDKKETCLQIDVTPDYINDFGKLLDFLKSWKTAN
jgi:hypothetical protein